MSLEDSGPQPSTILVEVLEIPHRVGHHSRERWFRASRDAAGCRIYFQSHHQRRFSTPFSGAASVLAAFSSPPESLRNSLCLRTCQGSMTTPPLTCDTNVCPFTTR